MVGAVAMAVSLGSSVREIAMAQILCVVRVQKIVMKSFHVFLQSMLIEFLEICSRCGVLVKSVLGGWDSEIVLKESSELQ